MAAYTIETVREQAQELETPLTLTAHPDTSKDQTTTSNPVILKL